jgi:hypothetical protein
MLNRTNRHIPAAVILAALLSAALPVASSAEDLIPKAGVIVAESVGNLVFLPAKAVSVVIGAMSGALSFLVTGGDMEVTRQVWQGTTEGPYLITPELAKKSIGERPLLGEQQ